MWMLPTGIAYVLIGAAVGRPFIIALGGVIVACGLIWFYLGWSEDR